MYLNFFQHNQIFWYLIQVNLDIDSIVNKGLNNSSDLPFKLVLVSRRIRSRVHISLFRSFGQDPPYGHTRWDIASWPQHRFYVFWVCPRNRDLLARDTVRDRCGYKTFWDEDVECEWLHVRHCPLLEGDVFVWILRFFLLLVCVWSACIIVHVVFYAKEASRSKYSLSRKQFEKRFEVDQVTRSQPNRDKAVHTWLERIH